MNNVFDDIMAGLHEVEEHQKGNIELQSSIITIPDDDFNSMYNQLPDEDKQTIKIIVSKMLIANGKIS